MILDEVKKTNVAVCKTEGYDEFYIVPGQVQETTDEIEVDRGANKSALKRAFMKSANNRMKAKPLLKQIYFNGCIKKDLTFETISCYF